MTAVCLKPKLSTKAHTQSSTFMSFESKSTSCLLKDLTATCISMVLYLRNIFPEVYFESKSFEGVSFKILKQGSQKSFAGTIQQWLEGAFEAIDKKYLKHLMLDIQDAETNMTLEIYTMSFDYKQGDETLNFILSTTQPNKNCGLTKSNSKLNIINLLQMCSAVTRNCGSLPPKITLAMALSYYENTPEDYQPRKYTAWKPQKPLFPKQTRSIEIGVLETPNLYFKFINKSCLNEKFFKSMESINHFSDSPQLSQQTFDPQASTSCFKQQGKKRVSQAPKKRIATENTSKTSLSSDFRRKKSDARVYLRKNPKLISCMACNS